MDQHTAGRRACVIGHISVLDGARWDQYRSQVPATLVPWGGRIVLRGACRQVLAGSHRHTDTVVLEFPSLAAATGWHASAAYQALVPLRRQAADVDLLLFEV